MSFLTPARLQDASRILRGVALVAARAAAESPVLRRAGQGDFNNAFQEALKSLSQQSRQVADTLDRASREQTGASLQQHLQRGQEAAEGVARTVADRTRSVGQEGQQAFQEPGNALNRFADQGRQFVGSAAANAQQTVDSVRQPGSGAQGSVAEQGQALGEDLLRRGSQGLSQGQAAAAANNFGQPVQDTLGNAAAELSHQADSVGAAPKGKSLSVNFSGGVGMTTGKGSVDGPTAAAPMAAMSPDTDSQTALHAYPQGSSMHVTAAAEAEAEAAAVEASRPQSSSAMGGEPQRPVLSEAALQSEAGDVRPARPDSPSAASQVTSDAAAVLADRSEGGSSFVSPGMSDSAASAEPKLTNEAQRLLDEEQKLSEKEAQTSGREKAEVQAKKEEVRRKLRERRVPSSPIGRVAGFAQLGASLVYGTMADQVSSYFGGGEQRQPGSNKYLTERNAERLADALCRMRGAALKLGQMLSIQDENVLPPQLTAALERVRAGADVMPKKQLQKVLTAELGPSWREKLQEFEDDPLAAASIGQVHGALMHDGRRVVLKIQYPGVARSIESDVDNLMRIISLANILPRGLYVENAAKVAKRELKLECDYAYEARCQTRFQQLIADDPDFKNVMSVPGVVPELSSSSVLCTEWVPGVHIDKVAQMPQDVRDAVGTLLLQLTLRELFEWRFMQTDPNWGNFLYDEAAGRLHLIDFGAAREFPTAFVDDYLRMVKACAEHDQQGVIDCSTRLGFLTGDESRTMLDAHAKAGFVVGTPFSHMGLYDFAGHHSLTKEVSELGAVMLRHRLTPPPDDSYSLHRKLSGAFLACIKLRARVPCRDLFYSAFESHKWGQQGITADELPELQLNTAAA